MNAGERDELIVKLKLIECRDNSIPIAQFGIPQQVGFYSGSSYFEFNSIPSGTNLQQVTVLNNAQLSLLANSLGISKASTRYKADVLINGTGVSLKSTRKAPPAIVNHTTRNGWEFAALNSTGLITDLDDIIDEYWRLRKAGTIAEDVKNTYPHSPFKNHISTLEPFLNYYIFDGTGSKLSKAKADYILSFNSPLSTNTWSFSDRSNTVSSSWKKMVFSLRAKKGMPANYPNVSDRIRPNLPSIQKWTEFIDGDYRGALHVRTTK